ncbi:uncharacterized protein LOC144767478 [Lissotriton helveticus]
MGDWKDCSQGETPEWCSCGKCKYMNAPIENVCCHEHDCMLENMNNYIADCITCHPAFQTVVLNPFVLETAYYSYRRRKYRRGKLYPQDLTFRTFRFTAYSQLTRWCWGMLGYNNRMNLPACAITIIRNTFHYGYSHL